ncbi:MAG: phosphoglucosamine mutase [Myxococcota bacterium]
MSERKLFGTDGIRGKANEYPMTAEVALALGRALGYSIARGELGRPDKLHRKRIVIGKDTRLSGYMIEQAIAAGITSMGVDVMLVGPLPTPGIAFITHSMRADAGVVVSASHNPFEDNGIKVFGHDGYKLPDDVELRLERYMEQDLARIRPTGTEIGRATRIEDAAGRYVVFLKNVFPGDLTLDGMRIVVDCAHGAAYKVAPAVLQELGAEVVTLGVSPDGTNINAGVGSLYPIGIEHKVRELRADVGIALDGDADRVIVVDEQGDLVDGDAVMAICARELHRRGQLRRDTLVTTVMSNLGLERCLRRDGISVERTAVGDRYVVERMRDGGFNLGGEQSGHLIFLDHATTGDGMVAALALLAVMVRERRKLSELASVFERVPQELVNVRVARKVPLEELPEVQRLIAAVEGRLGADGRVLVRYSGTEMKARVMIEGPDADVIRKDACAIADALVAALAPAGASA